MGAKKKNADHLQLSLQKVSPQMIVMNNTPQGKIANGNGVVVPRESVEIARRFTRNRFAGSAMSMTI